MKENNCCHLHSDTQRNTHEKRALINRLNRIEGQIRGIKNMVESDSYCTDILMQSAAVSSAINSFNRELLSAHIKGCVVRDIENGEYDIIDELDDILRRLMK